MEIEEVAITSKCVTSVDTILHLGTESSWVIGGGSELIRSREASNDIYRLASLPDCPRITTQTQPLSI